MDRQFGNQWFIGWFGGRRGIRFICRSCFFGGFWVWIVCRARVECFAKHSAYFATSSARSRLPGPHRAGTSKPTRPRHIAIFADRLASFACRVAPAVGAPEALLVQLAHPRSVRGLEAALLGCFRSLTEPGLVLLLLVSDNVPRAAPPASGSTQSLVPAAHRDAGTGSV
jgi:hypothetical protein